MPDYYKIALRYAAGFACVYLGVRYALPLIAPFFIGLSVAALVQKPAEVLSGRIPLLSRRACCVTLTFAVVFGAFAVIYIAVCSVIHGAMSFCPCMPERFHEIKRLIAQASERPENAGTWEAFTSFAASGANWCLNFFSENYRDYLPSLLRRSTSLVSGIPSLLTATAFAALSAFFGCGDFSGIKSDIKRLLPAGCAVKISLLIKVSVGTLTALMKTYGLLMLITFAELTAGLGIISLMGYGTGNIVTAALVISLIDILPVLGTGTVLVPWAVFELLSGRIISGAMLLTLFAIVEIVRSLIEPKLLAGKLEIRPFFTLTGVYVGGKLFGAPGIFLMPLAMMVFRQMQGQKNGAADV